LIPRKYLPDVHATMRFQYELSTENGDAHFNVRNARVNIKGNVTDFLGYFMRVDFCDRGELVLRDAYAIISPSTRLKLMMGQMRVPLSVDASRQVNEYWFAHSSLVNHKMWSSRKVGLKGRYTYNIGSAPAHVDAGVFSSASTSDHTAWSKDYTFGIITTATFTDWRPEIGFQSNMLGTTRCNLWDASLTWRSGNEWEAELEGIYKAYTRNAAPATKAACVQARRFFPLSCRYANRISADVRFDCANDLYGGTPDEEGHLSVIQSARKRITLGSTLAYFSGPVKAHLRLNYEQFFHSENHVSSAADSNRLCLELMLHF
ncbi:MAG: hypothetical protein K2M12_01025, partial [Muribaculaceae bacterium]|nr:hypothetical protein [Muribaculaceae bacterium]